MSRPVLLWLVVASALGFRLWGQEEAGNRAYRRGDVAKAVERYRAAIARAGPSPRLRYNLGTALLQLGDAESARQELMQALEAQSPELRAHAFYNLGNALVQPSADGELRADDLRAAIEAYRRALLLDPARDEARWNLELAQRRLRELEEERPSFSGEGEQSSAPGRDEGNRGRQRPQEGESPTSAPGTATGRQAEGAGVQGAEAPLPKELAEQILRAVEERERGLQREKLRRERRRVTGPDW